MSNLTKHLHRLTDTVAQVHRLPNVLADLAHLPPGGVDEDEAAALVDALESLNVRRDGSAQDPTGDAAGALEEALQASARPAADAFRRVALSLLARLDRLADRGVRPPDAVLAADFAGQIVFLTNPEHPHLAPTAWGDYDALPEGHQVRARLKREDTYDHEGRPLVYLGQAVTGEFGSKPLPWIPVGAAARGTLHLSTPQKASRQEQRARERAEEENRRQAWEDSKDAHVKRLESDRDELKKRVVELEARLPAGTA